MGATTPPRSTTDHGRRNNITELTKLAVEEVPTPQSPPAIWTEAVALRQQAIAANRSIGLRVATPAEYWGSVFADAGYNREPYDGFKVKSFA